MRIKTHREPFQNPLWKDHLDHSKIPSKTTPPIDFIFNSFGPLALQAHGRAAQGGDQESNRVEWAHRVSSA
jgi:hypothetical protein